MIWLVCLILKGKESRFLILLIDSIWWSIQIKTNTFSKSMSQISPTYAEIQFLLDFLYFYLLNIILIFTSSSPTKH